MTDNEQLWADTPESARDAQRERSIPGDTDRLAAPSRQPGHPLHALHATIGNSAVTRMLHREAEEEEPEEIMAKHDPQMATSFAQREGAEEELEDESVMAKHDESLAQRDAAAPEVGLAGGSVSDHLAQRIDAQRGGGSSLDSGTRSTMEDTLGTSLGHVRVHVGQESDQLNHAITAKAFTTGSDVFVRSDQWSPGSSSTQRLLAHELTHVAQQQSGIGGGGSGGGGGMSVGAADTAEEREADSVADSVVTGATDSRVGRAVNRHADDLEEV
jgi:Domain of unknown function (DUF4157)